jgi:pimeloyl-ACP methyl ester carboxylesterase
VLAWVGQGVDQVEVLDGAGHWLPVERPEEVNAALLDFLAGLESAPQSAYSTEG